MGDRSRRGTVPDRPVRTPLFTALHDRRRLVLVATGLLLVLSAVVLPGLSAALSSGWTDWDDPGAANVVARQDIERTTGIDPQQGYILVIHLDRPIGSADQPPAELRAATSLLHGLPEVRSVLDYTSGVAGLISSDGRSTAVFAQLGVVTEKQVVPELERRVRADPLLAGRVEIGGPTTGNVQVTQVVLEDLSFAETVVFPALFILLIIVFRGVVAALLPLIGGGVTIALSMLAMRGVMGFGTMSVYSLNLVVALGLGLSIDFSLLVTSRFRDQIPTAGAGVDALRTTMRTAGRTVLFSGLTVACALLALLVFPQRVVVSMGIAGILATVAALVYALLILPAILAVLGNRVESWAPRRWQRRSWPTGTVDPSAMRWRRIAGLVMRRPAAFATAASIVLLVLASPLLGVRFTGAQSPTTLPDSVSAGYVAEQLRQDFPDLRTDREELVIQAPPSAAQEVGDYASRVAEVGGVSAVDRPHPIDADHWLATVTLAGEPISAGNQAAMTAIGDLPSGFAVRAAGCTADVVALDGSLGRHLPTGVLVLVIATLLMLFAMTGSVVLPIKSVLMNALSLGASVGIVVWIFQLGNLAALFGTTGQGALESTSPLYLGAVAFGLSTDYGVFLLSRIKEARDQGMDDLSAIRSGVENTGRLVTSAAALMCLAMCAMILSRMAFIKELGLGAALAVIIDASIVRAVLVPALMVLLGGVNWWAPAPLRALHSWLRVDRIEAPVSTPADMTAYETVPNQ